MIHYILDYGAFLIGVVLHVLGKIEEYKALAESNPDPKIVYNTKRFLNKEVVNFIRLLIGGVALIIFLPMLIGGASVDIKNAEGAIITNLEIKTVLAPFYFLTGFSGSSGLFAIFGKYKKTLMNRVGISDN